MILISGPTRRAKARVAKTIGQNYQAETDGEAGGVYTGGGSTTVMRGFTGDASPPATLRDANGGSASGVLRDSGISFSVRKGEWWKITFDGIGSANIFFMPES